MLLLDQIHHRHPWFLFLLFGTGQACFNEALKACAQGGGRFERAASFLKEMQEAGLEPDGVSYSAVLKACERSARVPGSADVPLSPPDPVPYSRSTSKAPHPGVLRNSAPRPPPPAVPLPFPNRASSCPTQAGAAKTAYGVIQTMITPSNATADAAAAADVDTSVHSEDVAATRAGESEKSAIPTPQSPPDERDFLAALRAYAGGRGLPGSSSLALRLLTDLKISAVASAAPTAPAAPAGPSSPPVGSVRLLPEHYHAAMAACGRDGNAGGVLALLAEVRWGGARAEGEEAKKVEEEEEEETMVGLRKAVLESRTSDAGSEGGDVDGVGREEEARRAVEATRAAVAAGLVPSLSPVRGKRERDGSASASFCGRCPAACPPMPWLRDPPAAIC